MTFASIIVFKKIRLKTLLIPGQVCFVCYCSQILFDLMMALGSNNYRFYELQC